MFDQICIQAWINAKGVVDGPLSLPPFLPATLTRYPSLSVCFSFSLPSDHILERPHPNYDTLKNIYPAYLHGRDLQGNCISVEIPGKKEGKEGGREGRREGRDRDHTHLRTWV